ncbi:ABC transporter substrate-binding protein [Nocardioides jensenii]|uniref:ABC transporter substrate-binding protein n=1 Tax=Nocardioides jensenii TaxID=1843 RepID=UPI0009EC7EF8|nr:ABC transporter substrate-binding protein [Nocardioides jensenii]
MTKSTLARALVAGTVLVAASACSGGDGGSAGDQVFTMSIPSDPATMDPMHAAEGITQTVLRFAYDSLVAFDADGSVQPYLAEKWDVKESSVVFTLRDGISCSNGDDFTATDAAATLNFAVDPAQGSDYLRDLPQGLKATADDASRTVTVTTADPDQFLIHKVGGVLMVCPEGLSNPKALAEQTQGTGLFELSETVPSDHYTLTRRDEFTWGPGGVTAQTAGLPASVVLRVVPNETTAANLFLSGEVNALSVLGPDRERVAAVADVQREIRTPIGLTFFNQSDGRPGADPDVRRALTTGMDMEALGTVMTNGYGKTPESLLTIPPDPCHADTVAGALPPFDSEAAAQILDDAGWVSGDGGIREKDGKTLSLRFIYNAALGDSVAAAAELLRDNWSEIGVDMEIQGVPPSGLGPIVYESGDWDAGWLPITVGIPSDLVARLSGQTPPKGSNLASIDNQTYVEETSAATALPLAKSCPRWVAAEQALFQDLDVVPIVDGTIPTFGAGVEFELQAGLIDPSSIRMKG